MFLSCTFYIFILLHVDTKDAMGDRLLRQANGHDGPIPYEEGPACQQSGHPSSVCLFSCKSTQSAVITYIYACACTISEFPRPETTGQVGTPAGTSLVLLSDECRGWRPAFGLKTGWLSSREKKRKGTWRLGFPRELVNQYCEWPKEADPPSISQPLYQIYWGKESQDGRILLYALFS
jgi:hypothetical protein